MKSLWKLPFRIEGIALPMLLVALIVSVGILVGKNIEGRERLEGCEWMSPGRELPVEPVDTMPLESAVEAMEEPFQSQSSQRKLFTSELRVVAIGSTYPIPFEAEVCPFSGIPQPTLNQLDRDGDGITDDWETLHGLDRYNAADAGEDPDRDGFTNHEEFKAGSIPFDNASHPPYVYKLRFLRAIEVPFPLVFHGVSKLPDGRTVFQINTPADGKTYFPTMGEDVDGIVLKRLIPADENLPERLVVMRGNTEIELILGQKTTDPEICAELINVLDLKNEIATMGALLSLRDDKYTVLGVYPDRVTVRHLETGEEFEIVGLADGELEKFPVGFEE